MQLPVNKNNTRGHQKKFYKEQSTTKIRQSQFRLSVADTWNSLPEYVVEVPSIKSFERRLDKFWADQPIRFNNNENRSFSGRLSTVGKLHRQSIRFLIVKQNFFEYIN